MPNSLQFKLRAPFIISKQILHKKDQVTHNINDRYECITIFEQNLLHCVVASTAVSLYVALHYSWIGYTHSWSWMSHTFFPRLFSGLSRGFCCNAPHYSLLLCMYVLRWKENSPHNSYCTNWFSTYLSFLFTILKYWLIYTNLYISR